MTTSSDGFLTVTANNTYAGADISVDFSSVVPQPTVNLALNPNTELGTPLLVNVSNAVLAAVNDAGIPPGSWVTRLLATANGNTVSRTIESFAVSPGVTYVGSYYFRAPTGRVVSLQIDWLTSAGAAISTSTAGTGVAMTSGVYAARPFVSATAPATATLAKIRVTITSQLTTDTVLCDGLQFERGTTPTTYCDGYQTGCMWTGLPSQSMSVRPAYDEVTVYTGTTTVFGLTAAPAPNGQTDGFDITVPAGGYREYIASVTNGLDTKYSTLANVTSGIAATTTWLKSGRYPALSQPLTLSQAPDWTNDIAMGVQYPLAGRYPVVTTGVRRAETGSMVVECQTRAEYDALMALVNSDGPFLLQLASNSGEPDVWVYLGAVERAWAVQVASDPWRTLRIPLVVVATPAVAGSAVAIPGHTYLASSVTWPVYSSRTGTYGSR